MGIRISTALRILGTMCALDLYDMQIDYYNHVYLTKEILSSPKGKYRDGHERISLRVISYLFLIKI